MQSQLSSSHQTVESNTLDSYDMAYIYSFWNRSLQNRSFTGVNSFINSHAVLRGIPQISVALEYTLSLYTNKALDLILSHTF